MNYRRQATCRPCHHWRVCLSCEDECAPRGSYSVRSRM